MMATVGSESVAALEARLEALTAQRTALHARVSILGTGVGEVTDLLGEIEERLKAQETAVFEACKAAGMMVTFGNDYSQRTRTWVDGRGTTQLSGPRPLDSPRGQADHARRVLDALEAEAQPIRSTLAKLASECQEAQRAIAAIGGEINPLEVQIARIRQEEDGRVELIGRVDWRSRLAVILGRLGSAAGTLVL